MARSRFGGTVAGAMDEHLKQLLALARQHFEQNEYDKAEYLLRQVVEQNDRFADVYNMLGVIAHSNGDFERAQKNFERAVELSPSYTEARLNLMVVCNDLGRYDQARGLYAALRDTGSGHAPDNFAMGRIANMHAEIAQAYSDIGMPSEATRELEKAVALRPAFLDLRTKLAVVYRDAGDLSRAKEHLRIARETDANFVQARLAFASILLQEGQLALAKAELEEVLRIQPNHKIAQMYLRTTKIAEGSAHS